MGFRLKTINLVLFLFVFLFSSNLYASIGMPDGMEFEPPSLGEKGPVEVVWKEEDYNRYDLDISGLTRVDKAQSLVYFNQRADVYIEHNGELLRPTEVFEGNFLHKTAKFFTGRFGHVEVKLENGDLYDVDNWNGVVYQKINDLTDDKLSENETYYGWDEVRERDSKFYKAWDKKPHTFDDRQLSEPIKVSDLPQSYIESYEDKWVIREGEQARLTDKKLELIWREAERIDIDPFYFLAILAAEGRGSFDTKQVEGKHGGQPHDDFEIDVINAADVIAREISRWKEAGRPGDWLQWVNIGNADHIDPVTDDFVRSPHYFSGEDNTGHVIGGYAEDPLWWENVRSIYNGDKLKLD